MQAIHLRAVLVSIVRFMTEAASAWPSICVGFPEKRAAGPVFQIGQLAAAVGLGDVGPATSIMAEVVSRHNPSMPGGVTGLEAAVGERGSRQVAVLTAVCLGGLGVIVPSSWIHRPPVSAVIAWIAVVAVVTVLAAAQAWRIGIYASTEGLTIRNPIRTYRCAWAEIVRFEDGFANYGESGRYWALRVVLSDGRNVIAHGTATAKRLRGARPETLEALHRLAEAHGIPEAMSGEAPERRRLRVFRRAAPNPSSGTPDDSPP